MDIKELKIQVPEGYELEQDLAKAIEDFIGFPKELGEDLFPEVKWEDDVTTE